MRPLSWLGPLALTIAGGVVYHVSAKSLPKDLHPALVLVGAYVTALCGSLAAYVVLPADQAATAASSVLSPAVISVGLGATMIELGYVLAGAWRRDVPRGRMAPSAVGRAGVRGAAALSSMPRRYRGMTKILSPSSRSCSMSMLASYFRRSSPRGGPPS